ncbi:MAG: hypothetical protein JWQ56_611 [Pseudarthrobacter sp.]|nr:hypothetical protein [Pseudarthrobacter sp.]
MEPLYRTSPAGKSQGAAEVAAKILCRWMKGDYSESKEGGPSPGCGGHREAGGAGAAFLAW